MSGHSKWSTIKRQKGAADVKRGLAFTKISNAITIAVKQGGGIGDPNQNFRLRLAVDAAKAANMPKENVERAIKRAMGREAGEMQEVIYEGFAPGGISLIVEAVTDNPQRTTSFIKSAFNKGGASFGQPGSVAYQFKQMGQIEIKKENLTYDETFNLVLELGAEDIEEVDDCFLIYTSVGDMVKIKGALIDRGYNVITAELIRNPIVTVDISDDEKLSKIKNFLDMLEDLEDVQKIYTNIA